MTDVLQRLAELDTVADPPSDRTVAADLDRAHRALARRRRHRAALGGIGLSVALGLGLGTAVVAQQAPSSTGVDLVAYSGEQPDGFEVARVPDGFVVQGSNPFTVTIARAGDTSHPDGFEDKLVVMLESGFAAPGRLKGDPVSVNGHPGAIRDSGEAVILEFHDGTHEVVVQMWDSVGLTDEELVEFAEGVVVTDDVSREESVPGADERTVERVQVDGKWYVRIVPGPNES